MGVSATNSDLDTVFGGGSPFVQRMADFSASKKMADDAIEKLRNAQAEAQAQSKIILDDANTKADALRAEAQATLDAAKDQAKALLDQTNAGVSKIRSDTNDWVASTRSEISSTQAEIDRKLQETNQAYSDVKATLDDQKSRIALLDKAQKDIDNIKIGLSSRLDEMKQMMIKWSEGV